MDTSVDTILQEAQKRLKEKREKLKVTGGLTRLTPHFELYKHGSVSKDQPQCEHGNNKGYCKQCFEDRARKMAAEKEENERIEKEKIEKEEKERIQQLIEHPEIWLKKYGVPAKYINCTFDNFIGNKQLVNECKKYKDGGLMLVGNTGCGKTHLAVAILRELIKADAIKDIRIYRFMDEIPGAEIITAPDLLLKIRSSFRDDSESTEEQIINYYTKIPLLILDDLGSEKTTEYAITTLYIIIDRRDREMLSTVITTNLTLEEIEEKLDARIASRLSAMKAIKINMQDYRKTRRSIG